MSIKIKFEKNIHCCPKTQDNTVSRTIIYAREMMPLKYFKIKILRNFTKVDTEEIILKIIL